MPRQCKYRLASGELAAATVLAAALVPLAQAQTPVQLEDAKLTASDGATDDSFGSSVAITRDVVLVGAPTDDDDGVNSGSAYVFRFDGTSWSEEAKLTASDGAAGATFGSSVALSGDVAVIGAGRDNDAGPAAGSAYVFRFDGTFWNEEAKLIASDAAGSDFFGSTISIDGDVVLVGANGDDDAGPTSGSAYVFRFDGTSWNEEAKLTASDATAGDRFGFAVSISGNAAVAGARTDGDAGTNAGSAYVFRFDGTSWNEEAKLIASDAEVGDNFGFAVSMDGDRILVRALLDDDVGFGSGSAYVFHFDGTSWDEEAKLNASDGAGGDQLGISVSICRDVAVVGSRQDDDAGSNSGSAYVFRFDGTAWTEEIKLLSSDGAFGDLLGGAVETCENAVVGAIGDDDSGSFSGSAYVFTVITNAPPTADSVIEPLTDIGAEALVRLDGSGSSDPDDPFGTLSFEWTVDGDVVCTGPTCAVIEVLLSFETHEVTLTVTDPVGAADRVTTTVSIDPAELSVLTIRKVKVEFDRDPSKVKIEGEVGLPFGADFSEELPFAMVGVRVAGEPILLSPLVPVIFETHGRRDEKWEFDDQDAGLGIRKLDVNWKGAEFKFKEHGLPLELKSGMITTTETVLTLKLKVKDLTGPLTIDIDGRATVEVDASGNVTADVPVEVKKPRKDFDLTLPFPLLETTVITISGSVNRTVLAGNHLDASTGRYKLKARFDPALFPDGAATIPRTVDLFLFVGAAGYSGDAALGPDDLEVKPDHWKHQQGH